MNLVILNFTSSWLPCTTKFLNLLAMVVCNCVVWFLDQALWMVHCVSLAYGINYIECSALLLRKYASSRYGKPQRVLVLTKSLT